MMGEKKGKSRRRKAMVCTVVIWGFQECSYFSKAEILFLSLYNVIKGAACIFHRRTNSPGHIIRQTNRSYSLNRRRRRRCVRLLWSSSGVLRGADSGTETSRYRSSGRRSSLRCLRSPGLASTTSPDDRGAVVVQSKNWTVLTFDLESIIMTWIASVTLASTFQRPRGGRLAPSSIMDEI